MTDLEDHILPYVHQLPSVGTEHRVGSQFRKSQNDNNLSNIPIISTVNDPNPPKKRMMSRLLKYSFLII